MANHNHFVIRNDLSKSLTLFIEPEGALFPLGKGEAVSVTDVFTMAPVTVRVSSSDNGDPIVSIWPGDGDVRVEKDGIDVLDLIQNGAGV
jgi:hypothetical protein